MSFPSKAQERIHLTALAPERKMSSNERPNSIPKIPEGDLTDPEIQELNGLSCSPVTSMQNANQDDINRNGTTRKMSVKVYLTTFMNVPNCNESEVFVKLICSTDVTALTILEMVAEELKINRSDITECFGLWVSSSLLGMQLKHRHQALAIMSIWQKYLEEYAPHADAQAIKEDIPIICLRRNVLLSRQAQQKYMENDVCSSILYQDARSCVLRGEYLMKTDDHIKLAGIGFALDKEQSINVEYMKKNLDKHLPQSLANDIYEPFLLGKTFNKSSRIHEVEHEYRIMREKSSQELHQDYLNLLMNSCAAYGSAFFKLKLLKSDKERSFRKIRKFLNKTTVDVLVGVGSEFVTITEIGKTKYSLVTKVSQCRTKDFKLEKTEKKSEKNCVVLCSPSSSDDEHTRSDKSDSDSSTDSTSDDVIAIHLCGAESLLLHHLINTINIHNRAECAPSNDTLHTPEPILNVELVPARKTLCKAHLKNGEWFDPFGNKMVMCS